jgi:hypothetical protein
MGQLAPYGVVWADLTPFSLKYVNPDRPDADGPRVISSAAKIWAQLAVRDRETTDRGVRGLTCTPWASFLNPPGLFLNTSTPFVWRTLSAFLRA